MIALMLVLAIPCCFIEYKLTESHPAIRMFFANQKLAALAFSTAISAIFGAIFGAAGLIVFGAGMISTMIMLIVYSAQPTVEANRETIDTAVKFTGGFIKILIALIFLPFKMINVVTDKFKKITDKLNSHGS